jgi:hypothetical protein
MALVKMADGSTYKVGPLLGKGDSNAKLAKSDKAGKGYLTVGLSLAPAHTSGYQTCPNASPGCKAACLFTAGHGAMSTVMRARIAKTRFFFQERGTFLSQLLDELESHRRRASKAGKILAVRLNVVSDIAWEKLAPEVIVRFPDVQFYDYTKNVKRAFAYSLSREHNDATFFPLNYHITFSRSETNIKEFSQVVSGSVCNVAVVFENKNYPIYYAGRKVINGDLTDLRFLDPRGVIVGLYAKGKARRDNTGFVVSLPVVN